MPAGCIDFVRILEEAPWTCSVKKVVIKKNFIIFTGKYLCISHFSNKVAGFKSETFLFFKKKNRLRHSCFPVNFAKILRTRFLMNTSGRLFLWLYWSVVYVDLKNNCTHVLFNWSFETFEKIPGKHPRQSSF